MNIGIVGARKYQDRISVIDLVESLPLDSIIVTSSCKGVCTWVKEEADKRKMEVILFTPDLENIRSWFEVPKRYQQRNKEMIEASGILHAFISKECGYAGGTRFEVEYAFRLGKAVELHWENGIRETLYQYPIPFMQPEQIFLLAWEKFFSKTNLEIGG